MMRRLSRMLFYSTGIMLCFCYCGVMQEKMVKESSAIEKGLESYTYSVTFICIQCLIGYLYSILLQNTFIHQGENKTSPLYYWACAITSLSAVICSVMSLNWISFPVQVLGKSCKPLPVMCTSVLLGSKPYPAHKYVAVLLLVLGTLLFMIDKKPSKNVSQSWFGEVLLGISLVMDGLTAAIQDRMLKNYNTKALHMMASINKVSVVYLLLIVLITGKVFLFFNLIFEQPKVIWDFVMYSVVNAQGQVFLFMTIEHFGSLFSTVVTTTRKVCTLFASVFFFGHSLLPIQWIGSVIVLNALLLDIFWKSYYNEIIYSTCSYFLGYYKYIVGKKPKYFLNHNGFWV